MGKSSLRAGITSVLAAFAVSVVLRWESIAEKGLFGIHQLLIAHSTLVAQNWAKAGFFSLRALAYWNPFSVESALPAAMNPYTSFPAGAFFLPYLFSRLTSQSVTPLTFKIYALAHHLAIALTVFGIALVLTRPAERSVSGPWWTRLVLCLLPALAILFAPGYLWHFGHTWFGEQAGVLPFVGMALCDAIRLGGSVNGKIARRCRGVAMALLAFGAWSDQAFFFSVGAVRFACALVFEGMKPRALFFFGLECAAPVAIVAASHALLVTLALGSEYVLGMFRHALDHIDPAEAPITCWALLRVYASEYLHLAYGKLRYLLPLTMGLAAFRVFGGGRDEARTSRLAPRWVFAFLLAAPLLHVLFWRRHSFHHNFNTVRLDPFFALTTFLIAPLLVLSWMRSRAAKNVFLAALVGFAAVSFWDWHRTFEGIFLATFKRNARPAALERAKKIGQEFGFYDVLLSPDFSWWLSVDWTATLYSGKNVYRIASAADIAKWREQIPTQARMVLLFERPQAAAHFAGVGCKKLVALAEDLHYCRLN